MKKLQYTNLHISFLYALYYLNVAYDYMQVDQDGQFLLIEAAQELPEWLEPDNSDVRMATSRLKLK